MEDPGIHDALRALGPDEIDAIERFVDRLQSDGWIRSDAALRWQVALQEAPRRRSRCTASGGR